MKPQTVFFCRLKAYGEFNLNPMEVQSHKEFGLIYSQFEYNLYSVATLQNLYSFFTFNGHMDLLHFETMWPPSGG